MAGKRCKQNHHPVMWAYTVICALIIVLPLLVVVLWCFAESWTFPDLLPSEFGFGNYDAVLSVAPDLWDVVLYSIGLSLVVAAICVVVSLLVAHAIAYYDFKGRYAIDFLTFLPIIVPITAFGMGIHVFALSHGFANTFWGVVLVHSIVMVPYSIKILTESLRMMGRGLSEQAWLFGASPMRAFIDVSLPPLLPTIITAFSLCFIGSFGQYFLTLIIGGGKVTTLALVMFPWVNGANRGLAAMFAVIYALLSLGLFMIFDAIGSALAKNRKTYLM
ncbi:ABC transporter permease subunit [Eggerthellaceae bacterium zg-887]|uniref:ABC transporter permease n=1 Tax=Xiamenia xianingshaonis TaxID=2682776 RepID=UPI001409527B|nr:ABC transporter permease subunit [Xiamenia xianingshaonis]NGM18241.1 ABC transporter permease subunit [Eggerthellaceae bacterium zg-893]NHM16314.1 ABC transporter permease subunit [Xiamenia xianingshaonis]